MKGGSFTNTSGVVHKAEDILEKFVGLYFQKTSIAFTNPTDIYNVLKKYAIDNDCKVSKAVDWFKSENNFILETLNYETIEERIYTTLRKKNPTNTMFSFYSPSYVFNEKAGKPEFPADHPIIKKEDGKWKLYVNSSGGQVFIGMSEDATLDPKDAIIKIIKEKAKFPEPRWANFISGIKGPTERISFLGRKKDDNTIDTNPESYGFVHPKLIFNLKNDPGDEDVDLNVYYAEKVNDNEWKFHPHNMLNFLPNTVDTELFKSIFSSIKAKLEEINRANIYNLVPDKFYHIHVSTVANESTILLTIHGLFENFKHSSGEFNEYNYKVPGTEKQKHLARKNDLEGIIKGSLWETIFPKNQSNEAKKDRYREYSKKHNAYILLKEDGTSSIYTLSNTNQKGNPFFGSSPNPDMVHFALSEAVFGKVKYDINHMEGKGVILTITSDKCSAFCDESCWGLKNCKTYKTPARKIKNFYLQNPTAGTINSLRNWSLRGGIRKTKRKQGKKRRKSRKDSRK
jgi:hypothetical protein